MESRSERTMRDLEDAPADHLKAWLAAGQQLAADPRIPCRVRRAAAEQVATCRALLARHERRSPADGRAWDVVERPAFRVVRAIARVRGPSDPGGSLDDRA